MCYTGAAWTRVKGWLFLHLVNCVVSYSPVMLLDDADHMVHTSLTADRVIMNINEVGLMCFKPCSGMRKVNFKRTYTP